MARNPDFTRAQVERAVTGMLNAFEAKGIKVAGAEFNPKTGTVRILRDEGGPVAGETRIDVTPPFRKWD
ncbi:hypothetical protein GE300_09605 [Rhodobacteraceae bacterium 2CG4]|uniref:Uncharacterized protein n=1 Tax=Halovulum marinum TaxID=2662447 RepID=A0A6L5Z1J0_9RHOB|nr:hypothetical protein [Halovulum marinum]MSU89864.1 hypothetical protein [Halovulum marinum]